MANLLQRGISRMASVMTGNGGGARSIDDPRFWGETTSLSIAGQAVTEATASQLDIVQAVLERFGGTLSTLSVMVFRRLPDGEREPAPEHPLFALLNDRPNARQTAQEFFDEQQRHLAWWRNAYARIMPAPDGSPIGWLDPIHPSRVTKVERVGAHVRYTVQRLDGTGNDLIMDDQIWHVRKAPLTKDGLQGLPMWQTGRETLGRALAVDSFGSLYFANGGSGGGVIKHAGAFKDKEAQQAFLEAWRSGGTGLNRHKDRLLLNGADYIPFSVNNDEAQFIETTARMESKLCRLWNMPPHMVGIMDRATFSNIEQQSIEFVVYTLAPWICAWEQAADRDLLVGEDQAEYYVEFNVASLLRGDLKTRWAAYAQGRQWGWLSVNDILRLENMKGIGPAGDIYLQPQNMAPAGSEPEEPADAPPPGSPQEPAKDAP